MARVISRYILVISFFTFSATLCTLGAPIGWQTDVTIRSPARIAAPAQKKPMAPATRIATKKPIISTNTSACQLPTIGSRSTKGKRGTCGSKNEVLKANEIRITSEKTGKLVTFAIASGKPLGVGANGEVSDVVGQTLVVKKFKPISGAEMSFKTEVLNTRAVKKLTASGESTLGPGGARFYWLVTPKVEGKRLADTSKFSKPEWKKPEDCPAFLKLKYDELAEAVVKLEKSSGLVHTDLNDGNVLWTDGGQLSGLIDFGSMHKASSPEFSMVVQHERIAGGHSYLPSTTTPKQYALNRAAINWPKERLCNIAAKPVNEIPDRLKGPGK